LVRRLFEESEVLEVVKSMNNEKAPGLDGFTLAFFLACWDLIKADIMWVFHDFLASSKFEKVLMPLSLLSFQRNPGLLILRTFLSY
jgi:hypothetical protein